MVALVAGPGDTQVQHEVARKSLVRIQKIDRPWMFVSAVNDQEITPGGWIHQDELHWFPEAIDLYTPASPMRPWGSGTGANRLDHAANGLNHLANQLAEPTRRLEQVAIPFDNAANRIIDAANRVGQPIGRANAALGIARRLGAPVPAIPNPVAVPAGWAAHFAQFWAGAANDYYDGHARAEKQDSQRQEFLAAGELEPVEKRPVPRPRPTATLKQPLRGADRSARAATSPLRHSRRSLQRKEMPAGENWCWRPIGDRKLRVGHDVIGEPVGLQFDGCSVTAEAIAPEAPPSSALLVLIDSNRLGTAITPGSESSARGGAARTGYMFPGYVAVFRAKLQSSADRSCVRSSGPLSNSLDFGSRI